MVPKHSKPRAGSGPRVKYQKNTSGITLLLRRRLQIRSNSQLDVVRLRGQLINVLDIMKGIGADVLVLFILIDA